jgi:hypothetical protein
MSDPLSVVARCNKVYSFFEMVRIWLVFSACVNGDKMFPSALSNFLFSQNTNRNDPLADSLDEAKAAFRAAWDANG